MDAWKGSEGRNQSWYPVFMLIRVLPELIYKRNRLLYTCQVYHSLPDIMMDFLFVLLFSAFSMTAKEDGPDEHESQQRAYDGSRDCSSSI